MDEQLTAVLEWLKTRADGTEKFILEQAPLYAQEVLAWQFTTGIAGCIVVGTLCALFAALTRVITKDDSDGMPTILCGIVTVFCLGLSISFGLDAVKTKIAPRVVIIEHLKQQAGKK